MMGRGRGKGKKPNSLATREDGSGEEEKVPVKRRGRPTKAPKDGLEEEEDAEKMEDEEEEDGEVKSQPNGENGKKRKKSSSTKESHETDLEEKHAGPKANGTESIRSVGFRPKDSRRKNKPRRAAEVGVECK